MIVLKRSRQGRVKDRERRREKKIPFSKKGLQPHTAAALIVTNNWTEGKEKEPRRTRDGWRAKRIIYIVCNI